MSRSYPCGGFRKSRTSPMTYYIKLAFYENEKAIQGCQGTKKFYKNSRNTEKKASHGFAWNTFATTATWGHNFSSSSSIRTRSKLHQKMWIA
ncbi:hypothetical protein SLA2020_280580 [Shorea laevis]